MIWRQIQAFLWLRWRLSVNQWRRGGAINFVLMMIVVVSAASLAIPLFVGCFAAGLYAFREARPSHLLYAWDAIVLGFLFSWCIGLLAELQRTEILSISKFLHLPVSVRGVFAINYVSSLVCLTMVVFAPIMFGLGLGTVFAQGPRLLLALPLSAAFLLMVSALTYQFQGWLAALMSNPRRRRAVVVGLTMAFVLIFQLPNLLNIFRPWAPPQQAGQAVALQEKLAKLQQAFQAREIDAAEFARRQQQAIEEHQREVAQAWHESLQHWQRMVRLANLALPIGWLPFGVMEAADGRTAPAAFATLAMTLIGTGSLWRSYRATVWLCQGQIATSRGRRAPAATVQAVSHRPRRDLLEAHLPAVSESAAAVALAGARSFMRSPEVKMMALTPLLLAAIGAVALRQAEGIPAPVRPLMAVGALVFVLFAWMQLMANQFGFDRDGFRVFVLCGAPRREILLGKNLAIAPLAFATSAILLLAFQIACPMRLDQLLAMLPQFVSMYLPFCLLGNLLSIYAPVAMAAGSLKPASVRLLPLLLQLLATMIALPLILAPTLLPFGVEPLLESLGWSVPIPLGLFFSAALCACVVVAYRGCLNWQGGLLQAREQRILECVTGRAA